MNNKWLILDTDYLCHRAKYSTGDLSYKGAATGVIYGVLKEVFSLQEQFRTNNVIFCWDSRYSKRAESYPKYKANRKAKQRTPDEERFEKQFRYQMKMMRKEYLYLIGYRNNFQQKGYEADDLIAACKTAIIEGETKITAEIIIVSADHDLYQLIDGRTVVYHPQKGKVITLKGMVKQYGIGPVFWPMIKAIAGCSTDNIKGLRGIGEKTAIKIVQGSLPKKSKLWKLRQSAKGKRIVWRNLDLVSLPYPGTKKVKIKKNQLSEKGWKQVCEMMGFRSLRDKAFARIPE